ncbi:MAG: cell division protein FtsZ [Cytophagales bacterium]|nr:cell division protein FtsZ [Cytophagales bacterium]
MSYTFEVPSMNKNIIKVIGVGGGGGNAVNYMYQQGIKDVEFIVCNTDVQALKSSPIPYKLQIGSLSTEGLGAGSNPEMGKKAALEDKEKIRECLTDTKMVFITAGMGGGTGTGAAPILAKISKEMDILTVGIVTIPFTFEGMKKVQLAELGINELRENCDTVLVILNDKIRETYGSLSLKQAFAKSDNILSTAAKSIAEIITKPGIVNVDFNDVNAVMRNAGAAVMGSAVMAGKDRARMAAEAALHSPLLNNTDISGAKKILVSIIAGDESTFTMDEYGVINEYFQEAAGRDAMIKPGVGVDPELGESLQVTVIATGFEQNDFSKNPVKTVIDLESNKKHDIYPVSEAPAAPKVVLDNANSIFTKANDAEKVVIDFDNNHTHEIAPLFAQKNNIKNIPQSNLTDTETGGLKIKENDNYIFRATKLSGSTTFHHLSPQEYKDMNEIPSYIRNKVKLEDTPHSSDRIVSQFSLNEDNEILGNNKFLHDNVD